MLCVFCLAIFQFSENTTDVDLWGHVVFGQEFLKTGKLPFTEPYSWTAHGYRWINHENIAEIALAVAHRLAGGTGLLLLKMLVGLATFLIAIATAGRRSAVTWAFGALAVVEISFGFAARPQIFTALAVAIEFWILKQIHAGNKKWALALPVLLAVWINTHGGVLAGIVLIMVAAVTTSARAIIGRHLPDFIKRRLAVSPPKETIIWMWGAAILSAGALLLNPYGLELIRWLIGSVLWMRPEIAEWNPAKFGADHAAFFLCLAIAAGSFVLCRRAISLWELAVTGALGFMAYRSVRHTPLFCVAALAFVPPYLADALARFESSFSRLVAVARQPKTAVVITSLIWCLGAGMLVATGTLHKERAWTMEVPRKEYPVAAIEFMQQYDLNGNLLVFFDWGEECIWELPGSRVSVDGRLDTCYPRNLINAHWKLYNGEPFDETAVPIDRADIALLPSNLAGSLALAKQRGWQPIYFDDTAVVLARRTDAFVKLKGLLLPIQGLSQAGQGRAAFPSTRSPRVAGAP